MNGLPRTVDVGLLLLRVGAGAMLFWGHGWPKITHFAERAPNFADPIHLGPAASFTLVVFAEVFCAAFVAMGFRTRWAAIPLIIFFIIAGFIQHAADPWNRKALAFAFLVIFLSLLIMGPGRYSLDAWIQRRKSVDSKTL